MPELKDKTAYSLLRLKAADRTVYFVIANQYADSDRLNEDMSYLYEEHSCPTNWLRDCVAVIEEGNEDPHGFLTHVRSVLLDKDAEPDQWADVFPEVLKEDAIEGSAVDITNQKSLT